jgi:AmmeMemoRadiSam system protein A
MAARRHFDRSIMQAPEALRCSQAEEHFLLHRAREAIEGAIRGHPLPRPAPEQLQGNLIREAATFVTLRLDQQLRGCVGNLVARDPLYQSVATNAVGAAFRDARFAPLTLEELPQVDVHISILSPLVPLQCATPDELLAQLTPNTDGVVLRQDGRTGTFLPQVWNSFRDPQAFMEALARKAGLEAPDWKSPGTEVSIYRVTAFGESPGGETA